MENKQQLQNVLNIAYTLVFSFYTFINVVIFMSLLYTQSAVAGEIYRIAQIPIILLLCFIIFCRFYKRKYIVLMGACLLFALFGYLVTGEKRLLMLLLFAFAAQSISSHKVLKLDFIVRVCSFILVIFLSAEGILANTETIRADGTVRYALGFGHPNYGGIVLFSIFLEWIVLKRKKLGLIEGLLMILITGVFYIFFGARTDLVLTMFLVISVFVSQRLPMLGIKKFLSSNVVNKFVWILSGISVGTVIFINQNGVFYDAINKLLSSRLDIFEFYYRTVGMHLLPQKITNFFLGSTFAGMDNAYVFASIYEGVISLFIFCLFEQIIGERIRKQYIGVIIAYISILLMGLSESLIIYPFINFFVVFWNQGHVDNNDVDGEYLDEKNIKNNADI